MSMACSKTFIVIAV